MPYRNGTYIAFDALGQAFHGLSYHEGILLKPL